MTVANDRLRLDLFLKVLLPVMALVILSSLQHKKTLILSWKEVDKILMKSAGEIIMIQKKVKAEEKAEADEQTAASLSANITRVQVDLQVLDEEAKNISVRDPNDGFILSIHLEYLFYPLFFIVRRWSTYILATARTGSFYILTGINA